MIKFHTAIFFLYSFNSFCQIPFNEVSFDYTSEIVSVLEIAHGDLNGDNVVDFVFNSATAEILRIGINEGNLQPPQLSNLSEDLAVRKLTIHDIDNDEDQDVIAADLSNSFSYVWKNDGSGNFTLDTLPFPKYRTIHFADMTGDGQDETIVSYVSGSGYFEIYSSDTNGNFTLLYSIVNNTPRTFTSLDFNSDGVMDLALVFQDGVTIFQQTENLIFEEIEIPNLTYGNNKIISTDLNNDLVPDFILHENSVINQTTILKSTSNGEYLTEIIPEPNGSNSLTVFGDINQDNISDFYYYESPSTLNATSSVYISEDDFYSNQLLDTDFSSIKAAGISDLDNDGDQDIYLFSNINSSFDRNLVYFINDSPVDNDNDGYLNDVDCDDTNPEINPGQEEIIYNGIDDDCNNNTLDDDLDQDGYFLVDDCDDNNFEINPGQEEMPYNDIDDDCNINTPDDDIDEDGFLFVDDCDDTNPEANPDGIEIPNNGIDEDCDGEDLITSIQILGKSYINIYPNPTSDIVFITNSDNLNLGIELIDLTGRTIYTCINCSEIKVRNLIKGTYILNVINLDLNTEVHELIIVTD